MVRRSPTLVTALRISLRKSLRIRDAVSCPMTSANAHRIRKVSVADSSARRQRIERAWSSEVIASCTQHVAGPADRMQQARLVGGLELAAQVGDEDLDGVRRRERVVAPDVLEQPLARDDDALVAHEVLQQLELALGELDDAVAAPDLVRVGVQREVRNDQRGGAARRPAAQQRAQAGQQLLALEGLEQVVVGARVQALDARLQRVAGGEHEDRHVVGLAQPAGHVHAVELGQPEVEDDEVGHEVVGRAEGRLAVGGDARLVALEAQRALQDLGDVLVVLDDEDARLPFVAVDHTAMVRATLKARSRAGTTAPPPKQEALPMAATRTTAPKRRKTAPKSTSKTSGGRPPAKRRGQSRTRARRSSATWAPRLPVIEQRHLDLAGLALVACGVFLVFPLWLGWDGGSIGDAAVDGLALAVGAMRYVAPVGVLAAGAVLVMRPILPSVRPFKSGGICLVLALAIMLAAGTLGLGPSGVRHGYWHDAFLRERGGYLGEALFYTSSHLIGSIGTHILGLFLLLAGVLLITGASVAGVLKATGSGVADTTRVLRTAPDQLGLRRAPAPATTAGRQAAGSATASRPRVRVPEPGDDDVVVTATHVEAPALDGEQRYPDLFGDEPPVDEPAGEEPRVRRKAKPKKAEVDAQPEDFPHEPDPEPTPEQAAEDAAVADATLEAEPMPGSDEAPEQLELPAARGEEDDDEEIEYIVPSSHVLKRSSAEQVRPDTTGQEKVAASLIEALSHFNVEARLIGTVSGPHITRYELRLAPGVKMSKVAQLKDDLAYALAATEIRILAPIPGKQAVGIEVPNRDRRIVHLGDVFRARPEGHSPLTVWLGKDVSGKAIGADLAKMPHILVAGTTGAGKSACINAMLSSILLNATPEEARLVLVDPKQVELNHYEDVPHLLTPVITSPRQAANALQNLVREMEWRYGIMAMKRTRSLNELNRVREEEGEKRLPYILCVIDELADLMMVAPGDVEDSIIRIAQKARAVGIHLVLATQSPRVDVITGMIKANVPSRIAFAVSSQTDSRVILDQNGAESLLGMGDMLFSPVGSSKLQRIQGAYIDEAQIGQITEFWARQGEPELRADLLEEIEPEASEGGRDESDGKDPDEDPLLAEAIELVVEMGTASTSMLQRRMRLGYTRAGRMMDMLERRGVISGYEGSKPRQVLIGAGDVPRVLANLAEAGRLGGAPDSPMGE